MPIWIALLLVVVSAIAAALITRSITKKSLNWETGRLSAVAQHRESELQVLKNQRYFGLYEATKIADCITSKEQAATVFRLLEALGYENRILPNISNLLADNYHANSSDRDKISALTEEIATLESRIEERGLEAGKMAAFATLFESLKTPEDPQELERAKT